MSPTPIKSVTTIIQQKKAAAQKKFDSFFSKPIVRVNKHFGPLPSAYKTREDTDDDFSDYPYMIEKDPVLLFRMYRVLNEMDIKIPNANVKTFVAHKLLKWMIKQRPDVIHDMLKHKV